MADEVTHDFPLFPLALVALPGELVPLHIFEERYKTMMAECLQDGTELTLTRSHREKLALKLALFS